MLILINYSSARTFQGLHSVLLWTPTIFKLRFLQNYFFYLHYFHHIYHQEILLLTVIIS
jgi:hypothetical protein